MKLPYLDAHCDTLSRCLNTGESLLKTTGQCDLTRLAAYEPSGQIFAMFHDGADVPPEGLFGRVRRMYERFCRERNLDCIIRAKKPRGKGIRECLAKYDIPASQAALAGDQIFTDVLGANAQGVTSILVDAIHNHNIWFKGRHVLELPFIFLARKRRIKA